MGAEALAREDIFKGGEGCGLKLLHIGEIIRIPYNNVLRCISKGY